MSNIDYYVNRVIEEIKVRVFTDNTRLLLKNSTQILR